MTPEEIRQRWPNSEDCTCMECVDGCSYRPGWFLPDEVRAAAGFLGLSLREFFDRYLVLDWWGNSSGPSGFIGVLSPGRTGEYGEMARFGFAYSKEPCIFLKGDRCSIHSVKPHECRSAHHSARNSRQGHHHEVAKAWLGKEGLELLRELGYDPFALDIPEPDFVDWVNSLMNGLINEDS